MNKHFKFNSISNIFFSWAWFDMLKNGVNSFPHFVQKCNINSFDFRIVVSLCWTVRGYAFQSDFTFVILNVCSDKFDCKKSEWSEVCWRIKTLKNLIIICISEKWCIFYKFFCAFCRLSLIFSAVNYNLLKILYFWSFFK